MNDVPNIDGTWPLAVIEGRPVPECLGCGFCCSTGPCMLAYKVFKLENVKPDHIGGPGSWRCPALREAEGLFRCGLILDAKSEEERKELLTALYIGAGCCSSLNSLRKRRYLAKIGRGK